MGSDLPAGLLLGGWYTLNLPRAGGTLTADVHAGGVDPAASAPMDSVTASDATHASFAQVNVNAGLEFDTDYIEVR